MTTALRDHLAAELAKKVSQRGIVVWQDTDHEYADVAATLCPPDARFAQYDGSWYAMRRDVESMLGGDSPPKLVVYASGRSLVDDPLEEIRAAGVRFAMRLSTLVKNSLTGQLSEERLAAIGRQARTLAEAEAAVGSGGDAGDVRLIATLGTSDVRTMALRILTGEHADAVEDYEAWTAAADLLAGQIGGPLAGEGDDFRRAALRQMALTEIATAAGGLPDALMPAWGAVDADQRKRTAELLHAWQNAAGWREDYGAMAHLVDNDLDLTTVLAWSDALAACTATPALEEVAFREAARRLTASDVTGAAALAKRRLAISPWVQPQGPAGDGWATVAARWRAVKATAELQMAVSTIHATAGSSAGELLSWYVESGWEVDRAHRRLEIARNDLRVLGDLEPAFTSARVAHENWLDATLLAFTNALEHTGFDVGKLSRQGDIHARWVRDAPAPTAYVWVDALRFELATDLADGLRADGHGVELHAAVAAAPTITPVGMWQISPQVRERGYRSSLTAATSRSELTAPKSRQ